MAAVVSWVGRSLRCLSTACLRPARISETCGRASGRGRRPAPNVETREKPRCRSHGAERRMRIPSRAWEREMSLRGAKGDTVGRGRRPAPNLAASRRGSIVVLVARCSHSLLPPACLARGLFDLCVKPCAGYFGRIDSFVLPPHIVVLGIHQLVSVPRPARIEQASDLLRDRHTRIDDFRNERVRRNLSGSLQPRTVIRCCRCYLYRVRCDLGMAIRFAEGTEGFWLSCGRQQFDLIRNRNYVSGSFRQCGTPRTGAVAICCSPAVPIDRKEKPPGTSCGRRPRPM
jgi:hypothetical protein